MMNRHHGLPLLPWTTHAQSPQPEPATGPTVISSETPHLTIKLDTINLQRILAEIEKAQIDGTILPNFGSAPEPQYGQSGPHRYEIRRTPESVTAEARAAVQEYARLWAEIDARPRIRHPWSAP